MIERHGRTPIMHRIVEHGGVLYVGGMVADDRSVGMQGRPSRSCTSWPGCWRRSAAARRRC
ncbi:MAG: hypothetical protein WDN49_10200 [Acetobacteraceae bacterium]